MKLLLPLLLFFCTTFLGCQTSTAEIEISNFNEGWELFSSENLDVTGDKISTESFNVKTKYGITLPATVMAGLVQNGHYKDMFLGKNLENIETEIFEVPWWYRKTFDFPNIKEQSNVNLKLEGINYRANVWVNGTLVASADTVEQSFRMFLIDITKQIKAKNNVIAIETIPPEYDDLTIGFVDWNPSPPDKNLGIWREVKIESSGKVGLANSYVQPILNPKTLKQASLVISTEVTNNTNQSINTLLEGKIGNIVFSKKIDLEPNAKKLVKFTPHEFEQLNISNPKVWWPNGYGDQPLYRLSLISKVNNNKTDAEEIRFGIRSVEDYINKEGHRGYIINGQKMLIKSAGWVDDLLLADSDEKVIAQLQYVKNMNLNSIRLEGFWGKNKTIFDKADELGLLIMVGWSCQWEWTGYCNRPATENMMIYEDEYDLHAQAYIDQVKWIRNNPSVFLWVFGSDKLLPTGLEQILVDRLKYEDPSRPTLSTCKGANEGGPSTAISEVSGDPAVKMLGPYGYVTPNYWYVDKMAGGAYGFNTETGPGPQVPPIESIKKMIPEENLWPIDDVWDFHQGRGAFNTLDRYLNAFNARYGKSKSLEDFAFMSQFSNYEAIRAMYEAFQVNRHKATGVVQWMLNSAWPEMFWQLYDYYMMPNGAYYGTMAASRSINIIYNYGDKNVYVVNELFKDLKNTKATVKVLDINSKVVFEKETAVNVPANTSKLSIKMPQLKNISDTYFLLVTLEDNNENINIENFYWLSKKDDVLDYSNHQWYITPNKSFANLTGIRALKKVEMEATMQGEFDQNGYRAIIILKNKSDKIAFGIESLVVDKKTGATILPVIMSDNYCSLLPGQTKEISVTINAEDVKGKTPILKYQGVNVK